MPARALAAIFSILALLCTGAQAADGRLDPVNPRDGIQIARKVACSTRDGAPVVYWWSGKAYARRQGEPDRHLFNVEGMNIRACGAVEDPVRGKGYKLVSREILLYKDKDSDEVLKHWVNPWTGETVEVLHVANDPVNFTAFEKSASGEASPWSGEVLGDLWWSRATIPLWYPNPLGGAFQGEIGGAYHAAELFNFFGATEDLLNAKTASAKVSVGWSRIADWLPWMKMNGREGVMYMHTAGRKLDRFEDLSPTMKQEIALHYPEYAEPPSLSDARRNVTSWSYYKAVKDGTATAPKR